MGLGQCWVWGPGVPALGSQTPPVVMPDTQAAPGSATRHCRASGGSLCQ